MPHQNRSLEDWTWEQISSGRIADFHARCGRLDPSSPQGWDDDRRVSTAFLRKIFYAKPFRDEIPPEGVRLIGAWFPDGLALPDGHLHRQLWINQSRFEKSVDLSGQMVETRLSLEGSFITTAQNTSPALNLQNATIKRQFNLDNACIEGALLMNGIEIGQHLFMQYGRFGVSIYQVQMLRAI